MSYVTFALHAPYTTPVWQEKTLGNMVASHPSLLQYYKTILPILTHKSACYPEDFLVSDGQQIPFFPVSADLEPNLLEKLVDSIQSWVAMMTTEAPEVPPEHRAAVAKHARHNFYFGALAVGSMATFAYFKWDMRSFLEELSRR